MKAKVELPFKRLEKIADFYEFPSAVFFLPKLPKGKRKTLLKKEMRKFRKRFDDLFKEFMEAI